MNTEHNEKDTVEVSVVMPCLDEAETVGVCVGKAVRAMREHGIRGEVIVADNGSEDGSTEIAREAGARIVSVREKGYGSALMGGIEAARGRYVVMGDADDSYDFLEVPRFVEKLREGYDLVMGCRLPRGGGTVLPGAMPFLHRWWGNPMFSGMVRRMFGAPVHDVYCGLRGFTAVLYRRLGQRCTGMEFATEMVIKSSLLKVRVTEVDITLRPDGRRTRRPHLRTFSDGWRTLRFFMLYSPTWLYMVPGAALCLLGLAGCAVAFPAVSVFGAVFDAHTLLFSSLAIMLGFQAVMFGLLAKSFAVGEHLLPPDPRLSRWFKGATLDKALLVSALMFVTGLVLLVQAVVKWWRADFGGLDYPSTMRIVIPGVTLAALGFQGFMASCFMGLLRMRRK